MKDKDKTKEQLLDELSELRQQVSNLKNSEDQRRQLEEKLGKQQKESMAIFDSVSTAMWYIN